MVTFMTVHTKAHYFFDKDKKEWKIWEAQHNYPIEFENNRKVIIGEIKESYFDINLDKLQAIEMKPTVTQFLLQGDGILEFTKDISKFSTTSTDESVIRFVEMQNKRLEKLKQFVMKDELKILDKSDFRYLDYKINHTTNNQTLHS